MDGDRGTTDIGGDSDRIVFDCEMTVRHNLTAIFGKFEVATDLTSVKRVRLHRDHQGKPKEEMTELCRDSSMAT
jgi:hypothetical protein